MGKEKNLLVKKNLLIMVISEMVKNMVLDML